MTEEDKKLITREKHPGRVAQGHKLAALMKKRKKEILRNKELSTVQSTIQSTVQCTVQFTVQSTVQSTAQPTVQPSGQSNETYVYGADILVVLAIGVCVFLHITLFSLLKNSSMIAWRLSMSKNRINHQKDVIWFRKIYNK